MNEEKGKHEITRLIPQMRLIMVSNPKFKESEKMVCLPGKSSRVDLGITAGTVYLSYSESALCALENHPLKGREIVEITDDTGKDRFYSVDCFEKASA